MCYSAVFQTFHRKNYSLKRLNPEGLLGSYLCVILPASKAPMYLIFWINSKFNMIDYNIVIDIILPYIIFCL